MDIGQEGVLLTVRVKGYHLLRACYHDKSVAAATRKGWIDILVLWSEMKCRARPRVDALMCHSVSVRLVSASRG